MTAVVLRGDATQLPLPDSCVDAIVTDPPYGLEFMGRDWDAPWQGGINADAGFSSVGFDDGRRLPRPTFTGSTNPHCRNCKGRQRGRRDGTAIWPTCICESPDFPNVRATEMQAFQAWCEQWAAECLRVLNPGGHLLAFGGTRTWHRLACGIEDAGFEIRDSIDWIYGSGFPKNPACLKPAHEPIVMARKPSRRSGPLPGLDGCRVAYASAADLAATRSQNPGRSDVVTSGVYGADRPQQSVNDAGRWPPNVVLGEEAAAELDRQSGYSSETARVLQRNGERQMDGWGLKASSQGIVHGDSGGASRFFPVFRYEAKAGAAERPRLPDGTAWPTVKPVELIQWLVRLVTPPGGRVLDLFCGTGTTGDACDIEGFDCILLDRDPQAIALTKVRLARTVQPVMFSLDDGMPA